MPPVKPMLAKSVARIPPGMQYEAKWDGFRAIVHRDGDEVEIGSRTGKPLTRYFPELVDGTAGQAAARAAWWTARSSSRTAGRLDFDALLERIHPADSRVQDAGRDDPRLVRRLRPARASATSRCWTHRCASAARSLVEALARVVRAGARGAGHHRPRGGAGVVPRVRGRRARRGGRQAARPALPAGRAADVQGQARAHRRLRGGRFPLPQERPGRRLAAARACTTAPGVLQHVGVCASFPMRRRQELLEELEPLRMPSVEGHPWAAWADEEAHEAAGRMPGAPSRWSGKKDLSWVAAAPGTGDARWRTTTWRATVSGTPRSSAAGARTVPPRAAPTRSWRSRCATTWRTCWDRRPRPEGEGAAGPLVRVTPLASRHAGSEAGRTARTAGARRCGE